MLSNLMTAPNCILSHSCEQSDDIVSRGYYCLNCFLILGSLQSTKPEEGILLENLLQGRSNEIRPLPKEEKRPTVVNISIRIIQPLEIVSNC